MTIRIRKSAKAPPNVELTPSNTVKVVDVPLAVISLSEENPNEEDDKTFDALVDKIKEDGFDEPVIIMPDLRKPGHFKMVSGEHRFKAARYLNMAKIPAIIKADWSDDKRKIELVSRNKLRGDLNPEKFTKLYNDLVKRGHNAEILKTKMGFTKKQAFEKVFKEVAANLPAREKKKLEEAKETIKSIDDLSSVLNRIFKESGSELDHGYMVFSFGGKNHHYIKIDKELDTLLDSIEKEAVTKGLEVQQLFKTMLRERNGVKKSMVKKK